MRISDWSSDVCSSDLLEFTWNNPPWSTPRFKHCMAEDSDLEKTEPASPRRLEKAREEGQVVRSRELNTFLLVAAGVAMLWFGWANMYQSLSGILRYGSWIDLRLASDTNVMLAVAVNSAYQALLGLSPWFVL